MPGLVLYKFRNWSDEIHRRWLTEQQIYFASPSQFNDPFDCAINYRYDLLTEEEKLEKYFTMIKEDKPQLNDDDVKIEAQKWMSERLLEKDASLENNEKIIRDLVSTKVGILSLTKTKTPILLGSHYSNFHRGFCVGYDRDVLIRDFTKKYNDYRKLVFYEIDVTYSEHYPIIIPRKGISSEDYIRTPISTKAKFWEYEDERRIFVLGGTRELTTVPPEAIKEVTMGCNISDRDQLQIGEFVIKYLPHAVLYLSQMHKEKFELVFQRMN